MTYAEQVVKACNGLAIHGLARWSSGNASLLDKKQALVFIKPSGVRPHDLHPSNIAVVDLTDGTHVGGFKPSTDTDSHVEIYLAFDVGAIIHTHSNYATAFASCGLDIPCALTAMADEFGGPVWCSDYAEIGGKEIARAIGEVFKQHGHQKAVLIRQHGVFTFGRDLDEALKAAVLLEDCAKTLSIACSLGTPRELTTDQIASNWERYSKHYGQRP